MLPLRLPPDLADRSAPALVGVSGGRDSVALLHALREQGFTQLVVCHLDHGLRPESEEEGRFVAELAARMELSCVAEQVDVATLAEELRVSTETAAREARYAFFARAARRYNCHRLFLAHHADDQVETFLFNLFRGSGTAGLGGMRAMTLREIEGVRLEILRPLLGVWRNEIDAYVAAQGLAFREDASNADPAHTRNRLRHRLIPLIEEEYGRPVRQTVWRAAELLAVEDEWMEGAAELRIFPANDAELSAKALAGFPVALQRRALKRWLRAQGVGNVGYEEVEAVRSLLTQGPPAKVNLPGGMHARRRAGKLFLERGE